MIKQCHSVCVCFVCVCYVVWTVARSSVRRGQVIVDVTLVQVNRYFVELYCTLKHVRFVGVLCCHNFMLVSRV